MHGIKIAISGKGGVGKTTVCAVLARLFAEDGFDVLAIDADPNANLASAFGLTSRQTPVPLIKMKELIAERTGTSKDSAGAYFRLNPKVSDLPQQYSLDIDIAAKKPVKLLVLGSITQAGAGCACPEGAFLRALLTHIILQRQEVVLVDLDAGVEFMGRATVQAVDMLIVVVEPGGRSIETANNIAKMAHQLGIKRIGAIANKITKNSQIELIKAQLLESIELLQSIPYSIFLPQADFDRKSVVDTDAEIVKLFRQAKQRIEEMIVT